MTEQYDEAQRQAKRVQAHERIDRDYAQTLPTDEQALLLAQNRDDFAAFSHLVLDRVPDSRYTALALEALHGAMLWAETAILVDGTP